MSIDRRSFLQSSIATGLAFGFPAVATAQRDKVYRTALIGSGWWGTNILREAAASGRCKIVALVDVDRRQLDKCTTEVAKWVSDKPKLYEDYREMLEKEKPEIAIVATPDHWHPLAMIDAVKAGAHVYVEKPISHTIIEGKAMVQAARDANRVVQVGTHRRVAPHNVSGRKFLQEGKAGKIGMVRCFVLYGGDGPEQPRKNARAAEGVELGPVVRSRPAAAVRQRPASQGLSQLPRLRQRHARRLGRPLARPGPVGHGEEMAQDRLLDRRPADQGQAHPHGPASRRPTPRTIRSRRTSSTT